MVRVFICDDSATSRALLRRELARDPEVEIVGEAENGEDCLRVAPSRRPDVVFMDVDMPVLDGIETTRRLHALIPGTRIVALTARDAQETVVAMVEAGASSYALKGAKLAELRRTMARARDGGYLDDRLVPSVFEEIVRLFQEERAASARIAEMARGIVRTLAGAIEARDGYTGGHIERVSRLALLLAEHVAPELTRDPHVEFGYVLHDLGKLGVTDEVLRKPGPLAGEEVAEMRSHVDIGVRLLESIPDFEPVRAIVASHHEWWNGTGYPHGLHGDRIPLPARLFAVCDAYDAMTTDRPYRRRFSPERAAAELRESAGSQFDPDAVAAFLDLL